jgi:sarcosine oxidase subunit alpha
LIPENELSKNIDIKIDEKTGGPIVDQCFETSMPGIFACGNCFQVYDSVDVLAIGAKQAGEYAARFANGEKKDKNKIIKVKAGNGIRYITPQHINESGTVDFTFRVLKPQESVVFNLKADGIDVFTKKLPWVNPADMVKISVKISNDLILSKKTLEGYIDE